MPWYPRGEYHAALGGRLGVALHRGHALASDRERIGRVRATGPGRCVLRTRLGRFRWHGPRQNRSRPSGPSLVPPRALRRAGLFCAATAHYFAILRHSAPICALFRNRSPQLSRITKVRHLRAPQRPTRRISEGSGRHMPPTYSGAVPSSVRPPRTHSPHH